MVGDLGGSAEGGGPAAFGWGDLGASAEGGDLGGAAEAGGPGGDLGGSAEAGGPAAFTLLGGPFSFSRNGASSLATLGASPPS